ncbi:MAG: sugar transporter [Flavobacteriales bacterium]|nr:sugar transporter [Flavobacteriales bacterium]
MFAILPLLGLLSVSPDANPASWTFSARTLPNGQVSIELIATLEKGWHLYATELPSDQGPVPTSFRFEPSRAYEVVGKLVEPDPVVGYDINFGMVVRHHSGTPRFELIIDPVAKGPFLVEGEVEYMVCNEKTCLPPITVPFSIRVTPLGE